MDYIERRSRLTTFFRWILAIPHFFFAAVYGTVFCVLLIIAGFLLVIPAACPARLGRFPTGFLRYIPRRRASLFLCVAQSPPFSGAEHDEYPVRVPIAPPLEHYSRL